MSIFDKFSEAITKFTSDNNNPTSKSVSKDVKEKELKEFYKFFDEYQKTIDAEKYNRGEILRYLVDDAIDYMITISNRRDGKTTTINMFFVLFSLKFGIKFTLMGRHYDVRSMIQTDIEDMFYSDWNDLEPEKLLFKRTKTYTQVIYKNTPIGIITDLNDATDLKKVSNFLKHYPIIIYDEFLALEGDYLRDEWDKLRTIYASIDREDRIPYITYPRIVLSGNAINFDSPLLAQLNLFNKLETQEMNTVKAYDNIVVELRRNEYANTQRNLRAFNESNDPMASGVFKYNKHLIATEESRKHYTSHSHSFYIKLDENYLKVTYNDTDFKILLSVTVNCDEYAYNVNLVDNTDTSTFLKDSYYNEASMRRQNKGVYEYDNSFSKKYIQENPMFVRIKLSKCAMEYHSKNTETILQQNIRLHEENYIQRTKRALMNKFI